MGPVKIECEVTRLNERRRDKARLNSADRLEDAKPLALVTGTRQWYLTLRQEPKFRCNYSLLFCRRSPRSGRANGINQLRFSRLRSLVLSYQIAIKRAGANGSVRIPDCRVA
jgi:hypothetical protein